MLLVRLSYWLLVGVDELKQLIAAADDCNVSFVYALSPGLDVVYTSTGDIAALKAKLDQVHMLLVHGQVTIIFVVSVCLFVCAEFFSAVFDPISIKVGHILYVWV